MRATRQLVAALVLAVGCVLTPAPASAADLCADAMRAGQPVASPSDVLAASGWTVWDRVYGVFLAATGRATDFTILGPDARGSDGHPMPPHAFICPRPGRVPAIFVTYRLLDLIRDANGYDDNFLAMVLGHELGHRVNDFDWAGAVLSGRQAAAVERHADARGAFFSAAAGFRTRQLACDDVMNLFLNLEAGVSERVRAERKGILAAVLRSFDVYESLYEASAALLFWHTEKARALLGWVSRHMAHHVEPIGEFKVLEAVAEMMNAIDDAPWQHAVWVPGASPKHLRCMPVFPSHTAFWDDGEPTARAEELRAGAHEGLARAERLLGEAEQLGASELSVTSTLACVQFYQGQFERGAATMKRARRWLPKDAPTSLRRGLAANDALIRWGQWMTAHPAPAETAAPAARRDWASAIAKEAKALDDNPQLAAWIAGLRRYPEMAATARAPSPTLADLCPDGAPDTRGAPVELLPSAPPAAASGGCPCGWSPLHRLDGAGTSLKGSVSTCVPAGWGIGQRLVAVDLPAEQLTQRMLMIDAPAGSLSSLATWSKHCKRLVKRGMSDGGEQAFAALCPELGAKRAVVLADRGCRVRRVVVMANAP